MHCCANVVMGCLTRWYNTSRALRHRNKGARQLAATIGDDNERMSVSQERQKRNRASKAPANHIIKRRHVELAFALPLSLASLCCWCVLLSLLSLCPSPLLLSLTHSLSRARSLGSDAASCSCRCWPCAALARPCLARTYPVPPSPSRFSFAPISLSCRQALVAPRHQAAPLPLGCSLLLVEHHHHCTCHTFAINQSS